MPKYAVRKKEEKEYFNPSEQRWDKRLTKDNTFNDRDQAGRISEDAARQGDDSSKPQPIKIVPVETHEIDE